MSLRQHVKQVLLPVGVLFVVTAGAVWLVVRVMSGFSPLVIVGTGCAMSGTLLLIALWMFVLEPEQRRRLIARLCLNS
jgi:hypothetical protein